MSKSLLAHIFLLIANIIYAANFTVAKEVMPQYIQPFGFIVFRVAITFILAIGIHALFIKERVERKDFPRLFVCGLFGVVINQLLFFKGLNWTTPINASLIMTTTPILVLTASFFILNENVTTRKIVGISLSAAGAIFLILYGSTALVQGSVGDLLIFLNACSYAIYIVIVKRLMDKYNPLTVIKWVYLFGVLGVLPFGYQDARQVDFSLFPVEIWWAFFFVVLLATFVAFLFNAWAIKILSPTVVGIYIYSQPFLATLIALIFVKDTLTCEKVAAGLLIFTGVYLVSQTARKVKNTPSILRRK